MKKKSNGLIIVILTGMTEIVLLSNIVVGLIRGRDIVDLTIQVSTAVLVIITFFIALYRYRKNGW